MPDSTPVAQAPEPVAEAPAARKRHPPRPDGPPPPPVVTRLRLRYTKRGRMRFASHRDIARLFERAIRRGELPIAFSAGFSPHPKISWLGAAPTGTASEAEYVEVGLAAHRDADQVRAALDGSLPEGIDVIDAVVACGGSLAERIDASCWSIRIEGVVLGDLTAAVSAFLQRDEVLVDRRIKDGTRRIDARAAVAATRTYVDEHGCAILEVVVQHTTPAVRPDDILAGLAEVADLVPPVPVVGTRLVQGKLQPDGSILDPLEGDRAGGPAAAVVVG